MQVLNLQSAIVSDVPDNALGSYSTKSVHKTIYSTVNIDKLTSWNSRQTTAVNRSPQQVCSNVETVQEESVMEQPEVPEDVRRGQEDEQDQSLDEQAAREPEQPASQQGPSENQASSRLDEPSYRFQISALVKGYDFTQILFNDSRILIKKLLTAEALKVLPEGMAQTKLVYRLSEDGLGSENFHGKCDQFYPLIVLVKTPDSVFGYTVPF